MLTFGHPDLWTSDMELEEIYHSIIYLGDDTDSDKGYYVKIGDEEDGEIV